MRNPTPVRQAVTRSATTVVLTSGLLAMGVAGAHAVEAPGASSAPAGKVDVLGGLVSHMQGMLSGGALHTVLPGGILGG
ncbi:hypothetical protein ACGFNV_44650 [Streptomyces sp. NPDC048751]|uniref:hypothetical protein n=1 Tax=Streptomyces sp. NPDC048751 TaxID=3365591 RepID=UPI00371893AE